MDAHELSRADQLLLDASDAARSHRPGLARESLLRARSEYQRLHRPADVSMVDVLLAEELTRVQDRELAWNRLLDDVGWSPPQPLPCVDELTIDCTGGRHAITINADWTVRLELTDLQRREHVAEALLGSDLECMKVGREVDGLRGWAACRQRVAPAPGAWVEPHPLRWERPQVRDDGWAWGAVYVNDAYYSADDPSLWGFGKAKPELFEAALTRDPAPLPPENEVLHAADRVGSRQAVEELWQVGVHPGLVVAVHDAISLDRPISPLVVAQVVLRRAMESSWYSGDLWVDDPLPVGLLVELLGDSHGAGRLRMCEFLAVAGGSRDSDDPSRLMEWWAQEDMPVHTRVLLHRFGFDVSDLSRWAREWGFDSPRQLATAMQDTVPMRSGMPADRDTARGLLESHFAMATSPYTLDDLPDHSCPGIGSELFRAVKEHDSNAILRVAEAIDRGHPSSGPSKGECLIWIASSVQAMAVVHESQPEAATVSLQSLRAVEGGDSNSCRESLRMAEWIWVALERADGRPVDSLPVVEGDDSELLYSLLEWPAAPKAVIEPWVARYGQAVNLVWHTIRRSGVTLQQAVRWQPVGSSDPDYICWLSDYLPYPGPVEEPASDPWEWLVDEARRRARLWAAEDHSWLLEDTRDLKVEMTRDCVENVYPALEQALSQGNLSQIEAAARQAVGGHTYYRDHKSYRYHLDTCPVSDLGRLVLGLTAFENGSPDVWDLLIGDDLELTEPVWLGEEHRYPSPVCLAAFLGLTYRAGRLVDSDMVRSKWRQALSRTGVDGPWMLRMVLEADPG